MDFLNSYKNYHGVNRSGQPSVFKLITQLLDSIRTTGGRQQTLVLEYLLQSQAELLSQLS